MSGFTRNNAQNAINNIIDYTTSITTNSNSSTGLQIIAPSANLNGLIIYNIFLNGSIVSQNIINFLAKSTTPTNVIDGDVLESFVITASSNLYKSTPFIKVPQGKGVYAFCTSDAIGSLTKTLNYKLL